MPSATKGDAIPCAIHSATILANMALTYHLAVPQTPCSDNTSLQNAMTLYEMAYSATIRVEPEPGFIASYHGSAEQHGSHQS
jgi:hypothetical protein